MDSWLPARINQTTSQYYEAIGLLGSTYVDIQSFMHLIAAACISERNLNANKRAIPFVIRLGAVSLDKSIRDSAKIRYSENPEIVSEFDFICDLAESARIARNAYLHSNIPINPDPVSPVKFASAPDNKAPSGRSFSADIAELQELCKNVLHIRNYCGAAALWSLYPKKQEIELNINGNIKVLKFSSLEKPSPAICPTWVHSN